MTASTPAPSRPGTGPDLVPVGDLSSAYGESGGRRYYDEAVDDSGVARVGYDRILASLRAIGPAGILDRIEASEQALREEGATFRVTGEIEARVFPWDVLPRVIAGEEWERIGRGIGQRARALDAFLDDIYHGQEIVHDGVVPAGMLTRVPGFRPSGLSGRRGEVRAHIIGADLVCTGAGRWVVLEDNARMPSGAGIVATHRTNSRTFFSELFEGVDLRDPDEAFEMVRETLLAAAPPAAGDDPALALVTAGPADSGWYEQRLFAERAGLRLVTPADLVVGDGRVWDTTEEEHHPLDVLYVRMEEEALLGASGADGLPLGDDLLDAVSTGGVTIANALGNGVADDKSVYTLVPAMIDYYLGEEQILEQVPTYLCSEPDQLEVVLERLHEIVVKPIDGYGGKGITIGPECTDLEIETRRQELLADPGQYIAQNVVQLSTLPTLDGGSFDPRHVDLRAFVHLRRTEGRITDHVVPTGLTRVAPSGSMIVNSSRGGSGKDTWILR